MWNKLLSIFSPFSLIAKELSIIRELYELDLASRRPPIYRFTESPGKRDTEVTYTMDEEEEAENDRQKNILKRALEGLKSYEEDEDYED